MLVFPPPQKGVSPSVCRCRTIDGSYVLFRRRMGCHPSGVFILEALLGRVQVLSPQFHLTSLWRSLRRKSSQPRSRSGLISTREPSIVVVDSPPRATRVADQRRIRP